MSCQNSEKVDHVEAKNGKQHQCRCNGRCSECKCRQGLGTASETNATSGEA